MNGHLPEGWKWGSISTIADINPKTQKAKLHDSTPVSFIPMASISEDGKVIDLKIKKYDNVKSGFPSFEDGDVLFAKITPCMENGKGALVKNLKNGIGFGSTEFFVIRAKEPESQEFLFQITISESFRKKSAGFMKGTAGQKRVSRDVFDQISIPIPPLPEQRRIAEILSAADSAIEDAGKAVFESQRIKTGLMQQLIPRDTDNLPVGWTLGKLNDAGTWSAGGTPSRAKPEYYFNGTVHWIKSGDLNDGYVTKTEEKITLDATRQTRACINKIGSVALALYGATIGKTGIISVEAATNQACCVCTPYPHIDNRFLNAYLISQRKEFKKRGSGGAQPNISKEIVVSYPFPYPPLPEQQRIAGILTAADEQIALCQKRKALLQQTKTGLMQNLLSGKMPPASREVSA